MNPVSYLITHRRLNLLMTAAYMAAIFALSSVAGDDLPGGVSSYSTVLHVLEYGVLGFMAYPLFAKRDGAVFAAFALSFLYGVSDEVHQLFVSGRFFSYLDMAADALGSMLGVAFSRGVGDVLR